MTLQTKARMSWLDIARGITMLLVVFGHTLRGGTAQRIVYAFHVAAFFLLSGITCKTDNLKGRIKNDFLRILVPYYCFGIASMLIFAVLGSFAADKLQMSVNTSLASNFWELIYACPTGDRIKFNMPLWFLPCLFAVKMIYYALNKLCREKQTAVLVLSLMLAALGFGYTWLDGPGLPFNLAVSVKMLPYFSLGRYLFSLRPAEGANPAKGKCLLVGVCLLALAAAVGCFAPKVNYSGDTFPSIPAFLITSLSGSVGVCAMAMAVERCRLLEYIGKNTLPILVMHKFPILLFQVAGPLKNPLSQYDSVAGIAAAWLVTLIAIALCLAAAWFIRRFLPFMLGEVSFLPVRREKPRKHG